MKKLEKNIVKVADKYIKSWNERVIWEFELITLIINGNQSDIIKYLQKD